MAKINVYKAHEARMWVKDIVLPVIGVIGGVILGNDETRAKVKDTVIKAKDWILEKVKK